MTEGRKGNEGRHEQDVLNPLDLLFCLTRTTPDELV
jgi:hypothetical protein